MKKYAFQTADTAQKESFDVGNKNRKDNNMENSWCSSDDKENEFDQIVEDEQMRHCNDN